MTLHVRLTPDDLEVFRDARGEPPCSTGMNRFHRLLPDGIDCDWTPLHGWMALSVFGADYTWAAERGLVPGLCGGAGANLAGANLAGAYLAGAYLGTNTRPLWLPEAWDICNGHICRRES